VLALLVAASAPAAPPKSTATWSIAPTEAVGARSEFSAVDALSATDGWAVGGGPLVERWNGTRWSAVASPELVDDSNGFFLLSGVDATTATDAFAVGTTTTFGTTGGSTAVVLRWSGASWTRMSLPALKNGSLSAVHALTGTDAWAVGRLEPSIAFGETLALHWNGSAWSQVATPSPGTRDNVILSVAGSSPSDVWAVGYFGNLPYGNRTRHSLVLHWNGSAWSRVATPTPEVGSGQTSLNDVVALSPTDAWAVGYTTGFGGPTGAIALHWDGTGWHAASAPALNSLSSVTALSSTDLWATGIDAKTGLPRLAHWNGSAWTQRPRQRPPGRGSRR
jgi:hypothetical protein